MPKKPPAMDVEKLAPTPRVPRKMAASAALPHVVGRAKPVKWMGDAKEVMSRFPDDVKRAGGQELFRVQAGLAPHCATPIGTVGAGTYEIRLSKVGGWFRVFYVAKFADAIYVLHAFQKKTNSTSKGDIEIAKARYAMAEEDAKGASARR